MLLHTLGQGGFGEVWLAQDTVLGDHHVAIKFLKAANPDRDKEFLVEMRALAGLRLPGIVTFHHHFQHQKQLALVMEHCAGGSLARRLQDEYPVDVQVWINQVVQWMVQLCDTLAVVHARGLVHHDIKPLNILLRDGMAVIADFGIVNTTGGTVIYSSPGKGLGMAHRDDAREDIYALGVTLLELLNRGHPWGKLRGDELEAAKFQRALPAGLDEPTWLIEIALRAIHPDAALRFQTAADMAAALRARSVPVSVNRNALKAHRAVLAGEQALKRGNWRKAESAAAVAQRLSPTLPSAVLLAGRIKLLQHQTEAAYDILKDAAHGPSGNSGHRRAGQRPRPTQAGQRRSAQPRRAAQRPRVDRRRYPSVAAGRRGALRNGRQSSGWRGRGLPHAGRPARGPLPAGAARWQPGVAERGFVAALPHGFRGQPAPGRAHGPSLF